MPDRNWTQTFEQWQIKVRRLKIETYAVFLASRHPETPWYAKLLAILVIAYAFSPIDLIPDFIPIIGQVDDLILIPLGIMIIVKMIPEPILAECRQKARTMINYTPPAVWFSIYIIVLTWGLWLILAISGVLYLVAG